MTQLTLIEDISRAADISPCGTYRWSLSRRWDVNLPRLGLIMLNPSVADGCFDDPTIKSAVRIAKQMRFGALMVGNLFGLISPYPADLTDSRDPVGYGNDDAIKRLLSSCETVVAAWGATRIGRDRARHVVDLATAAGVDLKCFGINKDGTPKHPLYLPATTTLSGFVMPESGGLDR